MEILGVVGNVLAVKNDRGCVRLMGILVIAFCSGVTAGLSYNAGVVKYFFSTLLHRLRDERHFALLETSAIPTKARS